MPRQKHDPLLSALIGRLPKSGTDWPVDQQLAWLNLMGAAFGVVYGGDAAAHLGKGQSKPSFAPVRPRTPQYPFYVDKDGYARKAGGDRVMPKEVGTEVYDLRGIDADLRAIVWADDSRGLNGKDLTIVAA